MISSLFRVDESSTRHGGELVASVLASHGVQEIFTLCGGHISPILASASESFGIKVIDTRHEVTAVFAADAVARLRQSFGVAAVTAGPGITNAVTALKNAQMAESPVILLGGAAPTLLKNRGALQDIDQMALLRPLCKFTARVTRLKNIIPTLRKAIQIAQSGVPGPVFVELPIDVLYPYQMVVKEAGFSKNPRGIKKIIEWFLFVYISRQFSDAWRQQDVSPLPVNHPKPVHSQISQIADLIMNAQRPLMILGSQAVLPPIKSEHLAEIVKKMRIPVYLGGMCRGLLGPKSDIQMRQNRKDALKDADVVILAGSVPDFRLSYGKGLSSKSKVISVNRSSSQLYKNHNIFWKGTAFLQADVGLTLEALENCLQTKSWKGAPVQWINELRTRDNEKESSNETKMSERTPDGFLNPLAILSNLDKVLPDDAILVADGGDFVGSAAYIVRPRGPLQWLDPGAFGTLGVGGGFALGAKAVYPDRPVIIIYGDGACGFSLMEFDTFVRHKLPVIAVIGNDACWSQIARDQVPWFKTAVACQLAHTDYEVVGLGLGAKGYLIDKSDDITTFRTVLGNAIDASRAGDSAVINVIIGKSDFRQGSISV
ncbi:thiamine pyrophosphate enzyme, central domain-containing protein [Ditylenchus destructor]|nr:thiamine pyrophosphate enzyme, central domain-containing protein [Ditylenchus destructor]